MVSVPDHRRRLLEECGLSTDGMTPSEIAERAEAVLTAADRYRLQAEAPVLDEHVHDEFQLKDAEATMHTMAAEPYLTHVPTLMGGTRYEEVRRFYRKIGQRAVTFGRLVNARCHFLTLPVSFFHKDLFLDNRRFAGFR